MVVTRRRHEVCAGTGVIVKRKHPLSIAKGRVLGRPVVVHGYCLTRNIVRAQTMATFIWGDVESEMLRLQPVGVGITVG